MQHVAVASSSGRLHFLHTTDGIEVGSCDAGGALMAAPVTDPWLGHIWIASHARELIVCKSPGTRTLLLMFLALCLETDHDTNIVYQKYQT